MVSFYYIFKLLLCFCRKVYGKNEWKSYERNQGGFKVGGAVELHTNLSLASEATAASLKLCQGKVGQTWHLSQQKVSH